MTTRALGVAAAALSLTAGLCASGRLVPGTPAAAAGAAKICLEAEAGQVTEPMLLLKGDKECSGTGGIEVPEGVNPKYEEGKPAPKLTGDSTITFKVAQAGNYTLWGRAWWMDGCGNSFLLSIDGGTPFKIGGPPYKRWIWVKAGQKVQLSPGKHVLKILNSEDGAKLDQLYFTTDPIDFPAGKKTGTPGAIIK